MTSNRNPCAGFTPKDDPKAQFDQMDIVLCRFCHSPLIFDLDQMRWVCPNADEKGLDRKRDR